MGIHAKHRPARRRPPHPAGVGCGRRRERRDRRSGRPRWTTRRRILWCPKSPAAVAGVAPTTSPCRGPTSRIVRRRSRASIGSFASPMGVVRHEATGPPGSVRELANLHLPAPGDYRLHLWLEDAAGNQREANAAVSVPLRFDPEPPDLSFRPTGPRGSAASRRQRRRPVLRAGSGRDRDASRGHAHVARAEDGARGLTTGRLCRRRAIPRRPLRVSGSRARTKRATKPPRLRARMERPRPCASPHASIHGLRWACRRAHAASVVVFDTQRLRAFGRRVRLSGRLTNTDGQPIEAASIEALERRSDGTVLAIGLVTTDRKGRFRYVLQANRNRDVAVPIRRFPKDRRGDSHRSHESSRQHIDRTEPEQAAEWRVGALHGTCDDPTDPGRRKAPRDAGATSAGAGGRSRRFGQIARGRWRFRYRFGATLGRVTYRFRARLPAEGGYPFIDGTSRGGPSRGARLVMTRLRARLSYANVIATLALFVALGGTSYAVLHVGSDDVIDNSLRSRDIRNGTLLSRDLRDRTIRARDVRRDSLGSRVVKESALGTVPRAANADRVGGASAQDLRVKCPADTAQQGRSLHRDGGAEPRMASSGQSTSATKRDGSSSRWPSSTCTPARMDRLPQPEWTASVYRNPDNGPTAVEQLEAVVLQGGADVSYDRVHVPVQHAFRCVALPSN